MRIAQVAPLIESVPPRRYGGTERVVSYLTEALVALGHEVTLFASGDSQTGAELVAPVPRALHGAEGYTDPLPSIPLLLEAVFSRAHHFDLVHFHSDFWHFPQARQVGLRHLTTLHGRLDLPGMGSLFREFSDLPLVSISKSQRLPVPGAFWTRTVYHGLPPSLYRFHPKPSGYFAFLGRLSPEKGVERAARIAEAVGIPLKVAAKVDPAEPTYFEDVVRPLLKNPWVEFVGEITDEEKSDFLGGALGLLFPIEWPEPFGLVMVESLACGTPVLGYRRGAVPEVVDQGVTGMVVDDLSQAIRAVEPLLKLHRADCRRAFETRFSVERMVKDYLEVYDLLLEQAGAHSRAQGAWV